MTKLTSATAELERKAYSLGEVKVISADDSVEMTFSGYGAVFGNVDSYGDVIAKGAFLKTLSDSRKSGTWPAMLSQHGGAFGEDMTPIGVWTEMREDDVGLYVEGKFAPTMKGKEAYELLKMKPRPAYAGLSIGFRPTEWVMRSKPEEPRRTLKSVDLLEVSLVTFPANPKARVTGVKSSFNPREMEDALREAGLSRADSVKAVAIFKATLRDEAEMTGDLRDEEAKADEVELIKLAEFIKARM